MRMCVCIHVRVHVRVCARAVGSRGTLAHTSQHLGSVRFSLSAGLKPAWNAPFLFLFGCQMCVPTTMRGNPPFELAQLSVHACLAPFFCL
jgi:hypothetical protein